MEITPLLLLLCAGVCADQEFIGYRRQLYPLGGMAWSVAQNYCQTNFTDLLTVHSSEEVTLLPNSILIPCQSTWIGLHRRNASQTWSNGDTVDYRNWPDATDTNYTYCATVTNRSIEWSNCTLQQPFMCYQKANSGSSLRYTPIPQKMTWCGARSYCRRKHTDLAVIRDQSQYENIKHIANTSSFWIGLQSGDWEWSNGDIFNYRDTILSLATSGCGAIPSKLLPNIPTITDCSQPNSAICYKDVHLEIVYDEMNWEDAMQYCFDKHDGMVTIFNQSDQRAVEQKLGRAGLSGHVWVGLRQSRIFGFWLWTSDVPVQWSHWKGGKVPEMPLSNNCGAIGMEDGFKWSDQNCFVKRPFICKGEKKKLKSET